MPGRFQGLLCLGEGGEFGFPPGLQSAGHQAVFRLHRMEGPLGAVGLVAGSVDGELAARPTR